MAVTGLILGAVIRVYTWFTQRSFDRGAPNMKYAPTYRVIEQDDRVEMVVPETGEILPGFFLTENSLEWRPMGRFYFPDENGEFFLEDKYVPVPTELLEKLHLIQKQKLRKQHE